MGLALYIAFLGRSLFAYMRDLSPLGIAGTTVVAMELFYGMFYSALTMPLAITFCSIALLWRNDQIRRSVEEEHAEAASRGDDPFWQRA
jgi:hypothetical protein